MNLLNEIFHSEKKIARYVVFLIVAINLISFDSTFAQTESGKNKKTLIVNGKQITHTVRNNNQLSLTNSCSRLPNRTIDGTCNNITNMQTMVYGAADIYLYRDMEAEYSMPDIYNDMAGVNRPSPRAISNIVISQNQDIPSPRGLSSLTFTWGQFIDHDIDLTPEGGEYEPIMLPANEPLFTSPIPFLRSEPAAGTGINSNRQQMNIITSWLDGSQVYGSEQSRSDWLRTFSHGKLKTSPGNLLPYNTVDGTASGLLDPSAPSMAGDGGGSVVVFVAGDLRANEQPGLTALHTLFVREHNRICDKLVSKGKINDEENYQKARKLVGAYIQNITYRRFLPSLGIDVSNYNGYDPSVRPDISNIFASAAYRMGHTMVTDEIPLIGTNCNLVGSGSIQLLDGFFNPSVIANNGITPILHGLAIQTQQKVDAKIVDNLRNFLFPSNGGPSFGLDLASLNIQRGRDHGLPDYNTVRTHYTNQPANDFDDITSDSEMQDALELAYGDVDDIDLWVGLLAEDQVSNSSVGYLLNILLGKQFSQLRDSDYYYWENDPAFSNSDKNKIYKTTLRKIIRRNTSINKLQNNVFFSDECVDDDNQNGNLSEDEFEGGNQIQQSKNNNLLVFPNPSNGEVNVNVLLNEIAEQATVIIRNINGSQIYKETAFVNGKILKSKIDLTNQAPGIYFITIQTGTEIISGKIVIE
jgi:hypothetical protein